MTVRCGCSHVEVAVDGAQLSANAKVALQLGLDAAHFLVTAFRRVLHRRRVARSGGEEAAVQRMGVTRPAMFKGIDTYESAWDFLKITLCQVSMKVRRSRRLYHTALASIFIAVLCVGWRRLQSCALPR